MAPKQKGDAKVSTAASFDVPLPPAADLDKSLIDGDNAEIIVTVLAIVASDGARLHEVIKRYAPKHSFEGGQGKIWKVQLQPRLDPASQLVLPVIDMRAGPDKKMAKEGLSEEQLKTKLLGTPVPGMLKLIWTRYEQTGQILDLARNIIVQAVLSTGALGFLVQRLIRVSVTPVLKKHVAAQLRLQGGVAAGGGKGTDKVQAAADSIEGLLATQLAPQQDGSMADGLRSIAHEYLRQVKLESHADMLARAVTYKTLPPVHENLVEDWMRIGTVLLMILDAMDQANVVHRDLKPANFLMSIMDGGTWMATRLADLGLARMVVDSQLNLTPGLLGTPGWMHILRCLWKAVFGEDPIRISDKEMDRQCGGKVLLSMPLSGELLQRHPISLGVGAFRYMLSWFSTEYLLPCDDRVGYGNAPVQLLGIQFALDLYLVGGTSQELSEALLLLTLSQTVSEQPQGRAVFATRAASTGEYLQRSEALFEECRPAWEAHAAKRRSMPTDAILDGRVYNAKQRLSEATALVREILGLCAVPQEEMRDRRVQAAVEQLMQRQRSAATLTCVGSGDGLQLKVAWVNVEAELRCIRGTFGGAGGDGTAGRQQQQQQQQHCRPADMVAPGRDAEEHEAHEEREEDEEDELWLRKLAVDRGDALSPLHHILAGSDAAVAEAAARKAAGGGRGVGRQRGPWQPGAARGRYQRGGSRWQHDSRLLFASWMAAGNLLFAGPTKAMSLDIANSLPTAERAHVLVEMGFMSKQQADRLDKEAQKKLCFSLTCLMPALVSYANHALTQSMSIAAFLQQHPRALAVSLRGQQQAAAVRPAVAAGAGAAAAAAARPAGPAAAPPPLAPPPLAPAGRRGRGALAPVALVPRKAPGEIAAGGRPGGVVPLAMAPAPCQGAAPTAMPAAVRGLGGAAPTAMAAAPGAPLLSAGPDEAGMEEAGPEEAGAVDAGSEAEEAADAMAANVVMLLVHAAIQTCDSEQALKLLIHKLAAFNTQDLREIEDPASPLVPTLLQAAQAAQVQQACGHAVMERAPPQPGQQGLAGLQGGPTSEPPMPQLAATMERKRQCPQEDVEMEEAVQPLQYWKKC
ncbi:hypothetical protein HYH02_015392 [Chlamydomonas schloesseri]|nr:hypothetical protein HYH02_015392 [Chlamydomonas schloesseri]|eukprot:KAG2422787.1 hypothetical protein HYH02_015392 [Chlamydomonas schloesseri]